jgi:hypothetical protein
LEVPQSAGWISGKRYSFHPGSLPHFKAVLVPEFPIELFDPTMQFEEITIHSVCPNSGVDMAEPLRLHVKRGVDKKGDKTKVYLFLVFFAPPGKDLPRIKFSYCIPLEAPGVEREEPTTLIP